MRSSLVQSSLKQSARIARHPSQDRRYSSEDATAKAAFLANIFNADALRWSDFHSG